VKAQAKDLPDAAVLAAVDALTGEGSEYRTAHLWHVWEKFPKVPPKVVLAKLRALVRKRLVEGCDCGCRGDFTLLPAGRELLAATKTSP
jgi:hypothetical protein